MLTVSMTAVSMTAVSKAAVSKAAVVLTALCPQGPESEGPMAGVPHTISVATGTLGGGTAAMSSSQIYFKEPGYTTAAPGEGTGPGRPDFTEAAIFKGLASYPDIVSMSIGMDWILADNAGRVTVPSGGWGLLSISFTPGSSGVPNSLLAAESAGDGVPADLYSYIVPGSVGALGVVDELQRAQNNNEINIGGGGANIDAHDVFIAGYRLDSAILGVLPASPTFFFTVSTATLAKIPVSTGWWGPPSSSPTPSGATILMTTWTPSAAGGSWSTPSVFLDYGDLGLASTEQIDALAVDPIRTRLMFSTETPTRNPLLIALPTPTGISVVTYTLQNGVTPVSERLGMSRTDDVDAICALDPGRGPGGPFVQFAIGRTLPDTLVPSLPRHGSISVFRRHGPGDMFETWLNGWPQQGNPAPSAAVLALTFPSIPNAPMILVGGVPKNPRPNMFNGGPVRFQPQLQIPPQFSLSGLPVQFNWIMGDVGNPGIVALPLPVLIHL